MKSLAEIQQSSKLKTVVRWGFMSFLIIPFLICLFSMYYAYTHHNDKFKVYGVEIKKYPKAQILGIENCTTDNPPSCSKIFITALGRFSVNHEIAAKYKIGQSITLETPYKALLISKKDHLILIIGYLMWVIAFIVVIVWLRKLWVWSNSE